MDAAVLLGPFILLSVGVYSLSAFFSRPFLDAFYGGFNFLSGNYRRGDKVFIYDDKNKVEIRGRIESLGLVVCRLRDETNRGYVVPNSRLYDAVVKDIGRAGTSVRDFIDFELRYFQDLDKARRIMLDEGGMLSSRMSSDTKCEFKLGVVKAEYMQVKLYFWSNSDETQFLASDLKEAVLRRFLEEGVNLGYAGKPKDGYA